MLQGYLYVMTNIAGGYNFVWDHSTRPIKVDLGGFYLYALYVGTATFPGTKELPKPSRGSTEMMQVGSLGKMARSCRIRFGLTHRGWNLSPWGSSRRTWGEPLVRPAGRDQLGGTMVSLALPSPGEEDQQARLLRHVYIQLDHLGGTRGTPVPTNLLRGSPDKSQTSSFVSVE